MWHPFDIIPPENLAVADALRSATAAPSCRLVYGERILARFTTKDKIGTDMQWRPEIDQLSGVTLTRRAPAGDRLVLYVEQRWQFASKDQLLTGIVTYYSTD